MILKGNQRAGARQRATHLMNVVDNDHVTVHELRGFVADDLHSAFNEAYAISRGTKCKQFLFSLSLNPPQDEDVSVDVFENALDRIEYKLGLAKQPRAIVLHEKLGRRHAHAVWSRIKTDKMRAINLPHYKMKLQDLSRKFYFEHGWQMPDGYKRNNTPDPLNFSLEEWQQAKRTKRNPKEIKAIFQQCWKQSDDLKSFAASLKRKGYFLARGDRRGVVAIDQYLEVHSIARRVGLKNKDFNQRLGDLSDLPAVEEVQEAIKFEIRTSKKPAKDKEDRKQRLWEEYKRVRRAMIMRHREERTDLLKRQEKARIRESSAWSAKLPNRKHATGHRSAVKYQYLKSKCLHAAKVRQQNHITQMQSLILKQLSALSRHFASAKILTNY